MGLIDLNPEAIYVSLIKDKVEYPPASALARSRTDQEWLRRERTETLGLTCPISTLPPLELDRKREEDKETKR